MLHPFNGIPCRHKLFYLQAIFKEKRKFQISLCRKVFVFVYVIALIVYLSVIHVFGYKQQPKKLILAYRDWILVVLCKKGLWGSSSGLTWGLKCLSKTLDLCLSLHICSIVGKRCRKSIFQAENHWKNKNAQGRGQSHFVYLESDSFLGRAALLHHISSFWPPQLGKRGVIECQTNQLTVFAIVGVPGELTKDFNVL